MKNVLQTGCLILGILCCFYYITIGCYAGFNTSMSWLWAFGGGLLLFLNRALCVQSIRPKQWLHYMTGLLLVLIAVGFIVIAAVGSLVVSEMVAVPESGLEYAIVLGAQVRGTAPSRALRRRLDTAVSYAERNPGTVFILSGGQGADEEISEAECMYRYLTEKGVAPSRLILEDRSTSTRENLEYSAELLDPASSVGIISNNFHIWRALALARTLGYTQVTGIPASSDICMQPHNILREICCIIGELARGSIRL